MLKRMKLLILTSEKIARYAVAAVFLETPATVLSLAI
jgi:hypothetical protein